MKKVLKVIGLLLLVLVIVLVVLVAVFLDKTIKTAVETAGPIALGTPVQLANVSVRPLRGLISLEGFIIGNPEGYNTDSAIELGEFKIVMLPRSLFTDTIIIKEVLIDRPRITYEMSIKGSNIGAILENLEGEAKEEAEEKEEPEEKERPEGGGKKVIIEHLEIRNDKIEISSKILQGRAIKIPLPRIEMTDIGKEEEGASIKDVITGVFRAITGATASAVKGAGKLLGSGVKAGAGLAADAGGAALDVGKAGAGAVGTGAKKAVGAVGAGAGAVGSGAKKAVGAVGSGASKVVGGVTGIFKKDKKEEPEEE